MNRRFVAQACMIGGGLCVLAGALIENFSYAPDALKDPLTFGGIALIFLGLWLIRKDKQQTLSTARKRKFFFLYSVAVLVGVVIAFFGARRKFPDLSLDLQLSISLLTVLLCISFWYWHFFIRREK